MSDQYQPIPNMDALEQVRALIESSPALRDNTELLDELRHAERGAGWALNNIAFYMFHGREGFADADIPVSLMYELQRLSVDAGFTGGGAEERLQDLHSRLAADAFGPVGGGSIENNAETGVVSPEVQDQDVALGEGDEVPAPATVSSADDALEQQEDVSASANTSDIEITELDDITYNLGDYAEDKEAVYDAEIAHRQAVYDWTRDHGQLKSIFAQATHFPEDALNQRKAFYVAEYGRVSTELQILTAAENGMNAIQPNVHRLGGDINGALLNYESGFYSEIFNGLYADPAEVQNGLDAVLTMPLRWNDDILRLERGDIALADGINDANNTYEPGEIIEIRLDVEGLDDDASAVYRFEVPDDQNSYTYDEIASMINNQDPLMNRVNIDLTRMLIDQQNHVLQLRVAELEGTLSREPFNFDVREYYELNSDDFVRNKPEIAHVEGSDPSSSMAIS